MLTLLRLAPLVLHTACLSGGTQLDAQTLPAAPTVDGVLADGEWDDADLVANVGGVTLLRLRVGDMLYLGVRSDLPGILTVYVALKEAVRVLHASEAIGEARYVRSEGAAEHRLAQGFVWDRSQDQEGQRAYQAKRGWVASVGPMGPRGQREFALDLSRLPKGAHLAVSYAVGPGFDTLFVAPSGLEDGTANDDLQRGFLPDSLFFAVERWPLARAFGVKD